MKNILLVLLSPFIIIEVLIELIFEKLSLKKNGGICMEIILFVLLLVLLSPYIIIEVLITLIFGRGIGSYSFSNSLLNFYETLGFSSYVSTIANYEEDTGRCHRFYTIATKSYIKSHPKDSARGRLGNRDF